MRQAARAFHRAAEIATRQEARFLVLRAQMSLFALRDLQHAQADPGEHDVLLASLLAVLDTLNETRTWFTKGAGTADLQSATALLARYGRA